MSTVSDMIQEMVKEMTEKMTTPDSLESIQSDLTKLQVSLEQHRAYVKECNVHMAVFDYEFKAKMSNLLSRMEAAGYPEEKGIKND